MEMRQPFRGWMLDTRTLRIYYSTILIKTNLTHLNVKLINKYFN